MNKNPKVNNAEKSGYYFYDNKKNSIYLPILYAVGDGIYITLVIYIIYWVTINYNLIAGLPLISWYLWIVIFLGVILISFIIRYLIKKISD